MSGGGNNRQPGPINQSALEMLRERQLSKYTDLITADGQKLGQILRLRHRQEEIDPQLKYYASYFEVYNPLIGSHLYVPVDFVDQYDGETNQVVLSVTEDVVGRELWYREPTFIAGGQDLIENLPPRGE